MPRQLNVWLFGHPIGTLAQRLPALAQTQWASWQARGDDHPILAQIVALIAQRCSLTQRRLTQGAGGPEVEPGA